MIAVTAPYFYTARDHVLVRLSHQLDTQNIFLPQVIIHRANMATELEHALVKKLSDGLRMQEVCAYSQLQGQMGMYRRWHSDAQYSSNSHVGVEL